MDLVKGESFASVIDKGGLTSRRAAEVVRDVARALHHAHGEGIVHRDVKPDNILISEDGRPQLMDFGVAFDLTSGGRLTSTGEILGTPHYMAPEQAGRDGELGPATDVFSLGMVLYHALTGRLPYEGEDVYNIMRTLLFDDLPAARTLEPSIPASLDRVCMRCLEKNPEDRFVSAADLADDLDRWLEGRAVRVRGPRHGAQVLAARRQGYHKSLGLSAALLALAALVLVAVVWRLGTGPGTTSESPEAATPTPKDRPLQQPEPTPAAPWAPTSSTWRSVWSLGRDAAPDLPSRASWSDREGRVADPWTCMREADPEDLAEIFLGDVRRLESGGIAVRYAPQRVFRVWVSQPGQYFNLAHPGACKPLAGPPTPDGGVSGMVEATNDIGGISVMVGNARWRQPGIKLSFLAQRIDATELAIYMGSQRGSGISFRGRLRQLGVGDRSLTFRVEGGWHRVEFQPSARLGERVRINGQVVESLDQRARDDPDQPARQIHMLMSEGAFAFSDLEVEGWPERPDLPAIAVVPASLPPSGRISAAFRCEGSGSGGPFLALGKVAGDQRRLELDGQRLVLSHGDVPLAMVDIAGPVEDREGALVLERSAGRLRGMAYLGDERFELSVADPRPLAASPLVASYGSSAPRVSFEAVEVHAGPAEPVLEALDEAALNGRLEDELRTRLSAAEPDPVVAWCLGTLLLDRSSDPRWADPELLGRDAAKRRRETAAEALDILSQCRDELPSGWQRHDALARMVLAAVVATQEPEASRLSHELIEALGTDTARETLDALQWTRTSAVLVERLVIDYGSPIIEPLVAAAAHAAVENMEPELRGRLLFNKGSLLAKGVEPGTVMGRQVLERCLALFEESLLAGHTPWECHTGIADVLELLGRWGEALGRWERVSVIRSDYWWSFARRTEIQRGLGQPARALETAIGALSLVPGRPGVRRLVLDLVPQVEATEPGLAAVALLSLVDVMADEAGEAELLQRALALASPQATQGQGRDADLARYVLIRNPQVGSQMVLERGAQRATLDLVRAVVAVVAVVAEAGEVAALVRGATARDELVRHLVRLNPDLAPHLTR